MAERKGQKPSKIIKKISWEDCQVENRSQAALLQRTTGTGESTRRKNITLSETVS
jgi:hypothetical protein